MNDDVIIESPSLVRRVLGFVKAIRLNFEVALGVAVVLHLVILGFMAWTKTPKEVEVPFKEIKIKLGQVNAPKVNRIHKDSIARPTSRPTPPKIVPAAQASPVSKPETQPAPEKPVAKSVPQPVEKAQAQAPQQAKEALKAITTPDAVAIIPTKPQTEQEAVKAVRPVATKPKAARQRPKAQPKVYTPPAPKAPISPSQKKAFYNPPAEFLGAKGHEMGNVKQADDFSLAEYGQLLSLYVTQHTTKQYTEGKGILEMLVDPDGTILKYKLIQRTGYPELDDEIINAVERANPVPPIPDVKKPQKFRIPFRFYYEGASSAKDRKQ